MRVRDIPGEVELRRRPGAVRYFYLAVTSTNLHTGLSWGYLKRLDQSNKILTLYIADLVGGAVFKVEEPLEDFLSRWRYNYRDMGWNYLKDLENDIPVPDIAQILKEGR